MQRTSFNATTGVGNPSWRAIATFELRSLNAAMYPGLVAGLGDDEVLIARVVMVRQGRFYPREHEVAYWVANGQKYHQLTHDSDVRNQAIKGYYAVRKERLLSLVFG